MAFDYAGRFIVNLLKVIGIFLVLAAAGCEREDEPEITARSQSETRPNVLIFLVDALGPELGAYDDPAALTPAIDGLAEKGIVYTAAYAASGSEGAAWAALMTGVHPQTLGVVQDWTDGRGWTVAPQPEVKAFPELMRRAGYHTFLIGLGTDPFGGSSAMWDQKARGVAATWPTADVPQPFLGVIELSTLPRNEAEAPKPKKKGLLDRLFSREEEAPAPPAIDASKIVVPAYLPDTPAIRAALKTRYERIAALDRQIADTLKRLEDAGALNNTIVIVTARTGPPWPRAERTLYDSGVRVPLIVRHPDGRGQGSVSNALVSGVDLAPSVLKLVGLQPMAWVQGHDRLSASPDPAARYVFSIQNRVGAVFERSRAVRDGRWLFIRNEAPGTRLVDLARRGEFYDLLAGKDGAAPQLAGQSIPRPAFEIYDLRNDPAQVRNLGNDPARLADAQRLNEALNEFNAATPDLSMATTTELRDRFRPGGQTPAAAPPLVRLEGDKVVMEALTPGASIQWREDENSAWKLYRDPVVLPENGKLEAKSSRYGFQDSPVQPFARPKKK